MKRQAPVRLRPFRLTDVPLEIRLKAARRLTRDSGLPDDATDPRDRLLAALGSQSPGVEYERLRRVAEAPSPRVYWVTETAWRKVMG